MRRVLSMTLFFQSVTLIRGSVGEVTDSVEIVCLRERFNLMSVKYKISIGYFTFRFLGFSSNNFELIKITKIRKNSID